MLGIDYASSDEEDAVPATKPELTNNATPTATATAPAPEPHSAPAPLEQPAQESGAINGPSQGPSATPPPAGTQATDDGSPGSPYTSTRAIIQNLTLPTVPNFDIPPSPPGSPPQRATKKFAQFLDLKAKGQHFNQRLETSSVLRDPGHLQKLLEFAGVNEEDTYTSTLSEDVAVPVEFPAWAYVEELRTSQKRLAKAKEQEKAKKPRDAVEFVSATRSGISSGIGTPSGVGSSKRKELEHRAKDDASSGIRWTSRSRSPKRRRSRSRDRR